MSRSRHASLRGRPLLLVGAGVRGRQWAEAIAGSGATLVGVVDPDASARAAVGVPGSSDLEGALERQRADAAIIASPPAHHASAAVTCLEAGLGVLIEKPASTTSAEAVGIAEAAQRTGRPALVGQNFRFRPWATALDDALRTQVGAVRSAVVATSRAVGGPAHLAGVPHATLWDAAIHDVDLLLAWFGGPPAEVVARAPGTGEGPPVDYVVDASWEDGGHATYRLRADAGLFHHYAWLEGDAAGVRVENGSVVVISASSRPRRIRTRANPTAERALLHGLGEALAGRPTVVPTVRDNLSTLATMEAIVSSLGIGTSAPVDARLFPGGTP